MVELIGAEATPMSLNTYADPIRSNGWAKFQNLRADQSDLPYVRNGVELYIAAPVAGATLVDIKDVTVNGTAYLLGFFLVSSYVRIYKSSSGSAWEEITEVGGFSGSTDGNSRFANDTGIYTCAVVRMATDAQSGSIDTGREVVIIGNGGADWNRVWDPDRTVYATLSVTGVVDSPTTPGLCRVTFGANHSKNTGDTMVISGVAGVTAANGSWTVTRISATVVDLQGSVFAGVYTSGGTSVQSDRLSIHKQLTLPGDASLFSQKATFARYWQVASASGKTYYASAGPPKVNDNAAAGVTELWWADTTATPYTGANTCIKWNWGTGVATGDIATVYVPSVAGVPTPLSLGKGLVMVIQDISSTFGAQAMMQGVKIEVNEENVAYNTINTLDNPWRTVWDPSSTDDKVRRVDITEFADETAANLPITQFFFPVDHLPVANRTIYHIRVTALAGAAVPSANTYANILAICGAGSFPGTTEFSISYEDKSSFSESRIFIPPTNVAAKLNEVGGPTTTSLSPSIFTLPLSTNTFYDYLLVVANATDTAAQIEGGLDGQPSHVHIYARYPEADGTLEDTARFLWALNLYTKGPFAAPFIGLGWLKSDTNSTITHSTASITDAYVIDYTFRQSLRTAPTAYQIAIPRARVMLSRNGRLFIGDITDNDSNRQRGDGYFSEWDNYFRFSAVTRSAGDGGRITVPGETIKGFLSAGAGHQGVSHVHVVTDRWIYPMGGSGSWGQQDPLDGRSLSVLQPAVGRGTNSPRSFVEKDGGIFYLDHTGQFVRLRENLQELSRESVDNIFAAIPQARVDDVDCAVYASRVYIACTEAAGTTNTLILGWNDLKGRWEFMDVPPIDVERILTYRPGNLNGSGEVLLVATQAGIVYKYESGSYDLSTNPIAIRLKSPAFVSSEDDKPIQLANVIMDADAQANTMTFDRILGSPSGTYRTQVALTDGLVTDKNLDHTKTVQVANNGDEWSRYVQLEAYGSLAAGTKIRKLSVEIVKSSSRYAKGY